MTEEEFVRRYPFLFHMAHRSARDLIEKHGLLSTKRLLELFEDDAEKRRRLITTRRKVYEAINTPYGEVHIRDNGPIYQKVLDEWLVDMSSEDWFSLLKSMVYFFPSEERFNVRRTASAYRDQNHLKLVFDTRRFLDIYRDEVRLSPINSGEARKIHGVDRKRGEGVKLSRRSTIMSAIPTKKTRGKWMFKR
jgi:hypothetical protein